MRLWTCRPHTFFIFRNFVFYVFLFFNFAFVKRARTYCTNWATKSTARTFHWRYWRCWVNTSVSFHDIVLIRDCRFRDFRDYCELLYILVVCSSVLFLVICSFMCSVISQDIELRNKGLWNILLHVTFLNTYQGKIYSC